MTDRVILTNKETGQKLPEATIEGRNASVVNIRFDDTTYSNIFRVSDWEIEYVNPPLPTKPGWYSLGYGNAAFLSANGDWYEHSSSKVWPREPEYIAKYVTKCIIGRMVEVPLDE